VTRLRQKSGAGALGAAFGELELRVLEALWQRGSASVADVHAACFGSLAYTTVMTTLDRLYKKGALARRKLGRAVVYEPQRSREEMEHGLARGMLLSLLGSGPRPEPILSSLVDAVEQRDEGLLDELARMVEQKRRALRKARR